LFLLKTFKALNAILCADVPLRNYSLTHSLTQQTCSIYNIYIYYYVLLPLGVKGSQGLKIKIKKMLKTTGMTRGPMRRFQGNCREAKQR